MVPPAAQLPVDQTDEDQQDEDKEQGTNHDANDHCWAVWSWEKHYIFLNRDIFSWPIFSFILITMC